jgi:hypothetical protein
MAVLCSMALMLGRMDLDRGIGQSIEEMQTTVLADNAAQAMNRNRNSFCDLL